MEEVNLAPHSDLDLLFLNSKKFQKIETKKIENTCSSNSISTMGFRL